MMYYAWECAKCQWVEEVTKCNIAPLCSACGLTMIVRKARDGDEPTGPIDLSAFQRPNTAPTLHELKAGAGHRMEGTVTHMPHDPYGPVIVSGREHDPLGKQAHEPGAKLDYNKPIPWACIAGFSRALSEVAKVTTVGAKKYTRDGWMSVPDGPTRYMDAFGRHMLALGSGESVDKDTQCLHKAQMIWNLLASLELELREQEQK